MLVVAVLRTQSLRSCTAVENQMLSKGVYYACSEILTPCRNQASSLHQWEELSSQELFLSPAEQG